MEHSLHRLKLYPLGFLKEIHSLVSDGTDRKPVNTYAVCNFQSLKTPVELNSLLSKFLCYITWLVISPD